MEDFSLTELYVAEMNMLNTLNKLIHSNNSDIIYRQFITSCDEIQNENDLKLRDLKIKTIQSACESLRSLVNIDIRLIGADIEVEYTNNLTVFKNNMQEFLDYYTDQSDHSIHLMNSDGTIETLPKESAYIQICKELKCLHDIIGDTENYNLLKSERWRSLRSKRPYVNAYIVL